MSMVYVPPARSALMSRITGDDLGPEVLLRAALRGRGVAFERNVRGMPGTPDVVLVEARLAVFVDGCFWHGCREHFKAPKTRRAWWRRKIEGNKARDARVRRMLRRDGWRTMTVWEHELRGDRGPDRAARRVQRRACGWRG